MVARDGAESGPSGGASGGRGRAGRWFGSRSRIIGGFGGSDRRAQTRRSWRGEARGGMVRMMNRDDDVRAATRSVCVCRFLLLLCLL